MLMPVGKILFRVQNSEREEHMLVLRGSIRRLLNCWAYSFRAVESWFVEVRKKNMAERISRYAFGAKFFIKQDKLHFQTQCLLWSWSSQFKEFPFYVALKLPCYFFKAMWSLTPDCTLRTNMQVIYILFNTLTYLIPSQSLMEPIDSSQWRDSRQWFAIC